MIFKTLSAQGTPRPEGGTTCIPARPGLSERLVLMFSLKLQINFLSLVKMLQC